MHSTLRLVSSSLREQTAVRPRCRRDGGLAVAVAPPAADDPFLSSLFLPDDDEDLDRDLEDFCRVSERSSSVGPGPSPSVDAQRKPASTPRSATSDLDERRASALDVQSRTSSSSDDTMAHITQSIAGCHTPAQSTQQTGWIPQTKCRLIIHD